MNIPSDLKGTDSEKRPVLTDEDHVPDFFDHWMEEYISKVAADQPGTGEQAAEHTEKAEADGKRHRTNKERER
jgi:hypothetical protein